MLNINSTNNKNFPSNCNAVSSAMARLTSVRSSQPVSPKRHVAEELTYLTDKSGKPVGFFPLESRAQTVEKQSRPPFPRLHTIGKTEKYKKPASS
jgi:hypothetical protein